MSESKTPADELGPNTVLSQDDLFRFTCHGGLDCFTNCCRDVTIFLTPYDVLRLKGHLGISSRELLDKYTLTSQASVIPLVLLKMDETREKRCHFVTEEGCSVYEDRPWACRMYPLDLAEEGGYKLAVDPARCKGLGQGEPRRVRQYLKDQDTAPYVAAEKEYLQLTGDPRIGQMDVDNPAIFKMVFMATYNLDAFREFVFESSFLERFQLEPGRVEAAREDEEALLRLGYDWLAFGLFGQMNFQIYEHAAQALEAKRQGEGGGGRGGRRDRIESGESGESDKN
ncbi:MAG: YkgJ family cysteine cluster protein [bacterium]